MRAEITLAINEMSKRGRREERSLRYAEEAPEGVARAVCEALGEEKMEDVLRCVVHLPHAWADRPWEYLRKAVMPMARATMQPEKQLVMLPALTRFAEKLEKGEIG